MSRAARVVLQAENAECGLACLAMICAFRGRSETLAELRRRFPISLAGAGLKSIIAIADALGFTSRAVRCELDELSKLQVPCILHWDLDHYVVLNKVVGNVVEILDPARGSRRLLLPEVSRHFTGVVLELAVSQRFERQKHVEKVRISDLWSRVSGLKLILGQLIFLTLVLQLFGLLMPIANQVVVDDVLGRGDEDMLAAVIVGFGLIAFVQTAVGLLRNFIQLHAGQTLSTQLSGNILRHLLRLPTDFFERRHVGDIQTRFGSVVPVQEFLTGGVVGGLMDAAMLIPCGVIMFIYSPILSILIAFDISITLLVRLVTFGRVRRFADETLTLSARTQSIFLETVRAVRTIKLAGREAERHSIWHNAKRDEQNMQYRQATFNLWGSASFTLVMAAQGLAMLYFGAREIMAGHLTLGMFVAFQSYGGQFSERSKSIIESIFNFKMLGLHLERLGDIVHSDVETGEGNAVSFTRPIGGDLEIRNLDFRYAPQDPWVVRRANVSIRAGERVALIGPSGGGKSTLLKILTGLYRPSEGQLFVDGMPLDVIGLKRFRSQIGVVMQDDQLLSGTVADNVAFFDAQIDMERVETVCKIAMVHLDIVMMPMAYNSFVGDMGSIFSGGQRQRILLARALYHQPKILFMDEGTANLDMALEKQILENLASLNITQVMVAHRQPVIDFAEKVYRVSETNVTEVEPSQVHISEAIL